MWGALFVCACAVSIISTNAENNREDRVVRTPQGSIRGYKDAENNIFEFHSIPYAIAPKGEHKFKAPLPAPAWLDTFDAVDKGIKCPQSMRGHLKLDQNSNMEENCLVASVYVPDTQEKKLSVLVYVHGGAFQLGHGNMLTPKQLIKDRNIIVVTFNYRLGVNGFLCLGTENAPGNAGLKDQVALLRWVKKNIASFGGNPDDVTLAGYSAGSVSVELLLLSRSARGLFKRAIPESGSSVSVIAIQDNPLERAKAHARLLNFENTDDVYALENFYTSSSLEFLMSLTNMTEPDSTFGFVPCVERPTSEEIFLSDTPLNILKSGKFPKIPLLYGFTDMEGLFRISMGNLFEIWKDRMNHKFSDFLPANLKFNNDEEKEEVATKVKEFYFGNRAVGDDTVAEYVNYFTDILWAFSKLTFVKLQTSAGNDQVYLYEYSYAQPDGTSTGYKDFTLKGANHCAQTRTVLDSTKATGGIVDDTENYKALTSMLREMWANFVTKGKPVPEGSSLPAWPPTGADCSPHMSFGNEVVLKDSLLPERLGFWEEIYQKYYSPPVPPPTPPPRHFEL